MNIVHKPECSGEHTCRQPPHMEWVLRICTDSLGEGVRAKEEEVATE